VEGEIEEKAPQNDFGLWYPEGMSPCLSLLLAASPVLAQKVEQRVTAELAGAVMNTSGVLVAAPPDGLHSQDGPTAVLEGEFEEWFGIQYFDGGAPNVTVGCGSTPDWGGRTPVTPVTFSMEEEHCVAIVRHGNLRIETTMEISASGQYVLGHVRFVNEGEHVISALMYSREWRQPEIEGWNFPPDFVPDLLRPSGICRLVWMMDDLPPGLDSGLRFSYRIGEEEELVGPPEVPLELFLMEPWGPNGVNFGPTNGVSFGDFDADGYIDIYSQESGRLLRNLQGENWVLATDIDDQINNAGLHYGASFGDYNNDGLPDIGTETRTGCTHLLKNLGDGVFVDIATDPELFEIQPCNVPAETICWGDVDDDGDLDMFLPVYPGSAGGPGNFFYENLGPDETGEYRLIETSAEAGLNNPPMTARPEGAQFFDADFDGELDCYCNGVLYQNNTTGEIDFDDMITAGSGIGYRRRLEEGAAFFDYDLDGDYDLFISYNDVGVNCWENEGDGTFFLEETIIDEPFMGLALGLSCEDWDNDGDIDFTTRQIFRRNQYMETGERRFTLASQTIPAAHRRNATPSWGDWDLDGDLDCALGNWMNNGRFYENVLYTEETPEDQKPYVRVRPLRDSVDVPRGLETEFGANVEIVLASRPKGKRFKKFVSSAGGYLNQNEYALHFPMPPGPNPEVPIEGVSFDVIVDFTSRQDRGVLRVDKHVNPVLGEIDLASLQTRELKVFRSGKVIRDGITYPPNSQGYDFRLQVTGGGLGLPTPTLAMDDPIVPPGSDHWAGIEFDTHGAARSVLVKEIVLDGQAGNVVSCGLRSANFLVWDVTDPQNPEAVYIDVLETSDRNDRTSFVRTFKLFKDRVYRAVARVDELRATPIAGPVGTGPITLRGGLSYRDGDPCGGAGVRMAEVDDRAMYLALRFVTPDPLGRIR